MSTRLRITLSQYLELAEACDWILAKEESAVAIPFLHVRKEHPELLKDYQDLFEAGSSFHLGDIFASRVKAFIAFAKICVSAVIRGFPKTTVIDALPDADVIIVSHIVNLEQASNGTDPYFGKLAHVLKQDYGLKALTLWLSHVPQHVTHINQPDPNLTHVVVPKSLNLLHELGFIIEALVLWLKLGRLHPSSELQRKLLCVSRDRVLSSGSIKSLRQKYIFQKVIAQTDAKCIAFTWEGHAYERLLVSAVKSSGSKIRDIAYMHAPVTEFQHSAFRRLSAKYNPENFFVRGKVAAKRLRLSYPRAAVSSIVTYAGNPQPTRAVPDDPAEGISILVLPEGFTNETFFMIKFALQCAEISPKMRFIIRTHPILNKASVFAEILENTWPPSVSLSVNSLKGDAERCQYALFRGSSAIFEAIQSGCRPVYVQKKESHSISPLYSIEKMVLNVSSPAQFSALLEKPYLTTHEIMSRECGEVFGQPSWPVAAKAIANAI